MDEPKPKKTRPANTQNKSWFSAKRSVPFSQRPKKKFVLFNKYKLVHGEENELKANLSRITDGGAKRTSKKKKNKKAKHPTDGPKQINTNIDNKKNDKRKRDIKDEKVNPKGEKRRKTQKYRFFE